MRHDRLRGQLHEPFLGFLVPLHLGGGLIGPGPFRSSACAGLFTRTGLVACAGFTGAGALVSTGPGVCISIVAIELPVDGQGGGGTVVVLAVHLSRGHGDRAVHVLQVRQRLGELLGDVLGLRCQGHGGVVARGDRSGQGRGGLLRCGAGITETAGGGQHQGDREAEHRRGTAEAGGTERTGGPAGRLERTGTAR
ncbi:hypothetical protein ACFFX0_12755 [Citricoccus parietis]|uniref:Uncharacterized protein n=1 Tax=Citricoccus parietis TaxID=592307 RepID=A0ABV5FZD0_9MICC